MKNTSKTFGIIAIVAIIGFVMTSCQTTSSGPNKLEAASKQADAAAATAGADYSSMPAIDWPSNTVWGQYGLAGLQQPEGTSVVGGQQGAGMYQVALLDANKAVYDNIAGQLSAMSGITKSGEDTDDKGSASVFMTDAFKMILLSYSIADNVVVIGIQ